MDPSQMSPEQMAAMAKEQCIFCQIASGKIASRKVYEDDKVVAVLDINPANPGHVLLMTKEHYVVMPQIPEDITAHIGMVTKAVSHALLRAIKAQGTTIFIANGVAAGQRAQHFMLHIIPRMENDRIGIEYPEHTITEEDYAKIHGTLKKSIAKTMGTEEQEEDSTEEEKEKEDTETEEEKEKPEEESDEEETEEDEKKSKKQTEEKEEETTEQAEKNKTKNKQAKPKKKTKAKKQEPEEEIDEERQKLDQIASMLTGR